MALLEYMHELADEMPNKSYYASIEIYPGELCRQLHMYNY